MMFKIKQINSGAWGILTIGVDVTGRFRFCSAGMDVLAVLDKIDGRKVQYVKA